MRLGPVNFVLKHKLKPTDPKDSFGGFCFVLFFRSLSFRKLNFYF